MSFNVTYKGPMVLRANQLFKAELQIKLEKELQPGGRITVAARHTSDFGDAQTDSFDEENFVSISTDQSSTEWELDPSHQMYRHPWNTGFEFILKRGHLNPGNTIKIQLGGSKGYRSQSFIEPNFTLLIGVKSNREAKWIVSSPSNSPQLKIIGARAVVIRVHVTNINSKYPNRRVCLKLEDTYGNLANVGEMKIDLLLDDKKSVQQIKMNTNMLEIENVPLSADGEWHRLTAVSQDSQFFARSNPFGPSLVKGYNLYWGDLHCMSRLCCGTSSPAYFYEYGRKAAGLDFASVTSIETTLGMQFTLNDWDEVKEATKNAHRPHLYVTFLAHEWGGQTELGGDHNIYFLSDDAPMLYSQRLTSPPIWLDVKDYQEKKYIERTRTISEIITELGDLPVLIIPHCGGREANFDFYDADKMPVFEIHSRQRNYEGIAFQAIQRGIKFGFIGDSDSHRSVMGDSLNLAREEVMSSRNGLAGVYAKELTRESIWEAIFARRVYATNGCKLVLSFTVNGVLMGSELPMNIGEELHFVFDVVLDGLFDHAELVCQTSTIARFSPAVRENRISRFHGEYKDKVQTGTTAYYLRVYQTDGGMAWSSPVWVVAK